MPSTPSASRERVDRFRWNRHYFQYPDRLRRWRTKLSVLAIVVAGGWLAMGWALPEESRQYRYTHGPVANPHRAWEKNCQACHASFSMGDAGIGNIVDVHSRWHEFRCETCHQGPANDDPKNYAPHHASANWTHAKATDCGQCHHEHQGRHASLVTLPDSDCTVCHQELKEHHTDRAPKYRSGIGRFEAGRSDSHPEFRKVAAGTAVNRTLRFDHARHLSQGMKLNANQTTGLWTLDDIKDETERERFRQSGQKGSDPVSLSCAQCHEPDSAGASMRPISYKNHCQACHPTESGPVGFEFGLPLKSDHVPHGAPPNVLDEHLRNWIVAGLSKSVQPPPHAPKRNVGDRLDPRVNWELEQLRSLSDLTNALVKQARLQLGINSCAKCHESTSGNAASLDVARPNSPPIWYPSAKFNHLSHRLMTCSSCHPANFQLGERVQPEHLDLPGIDNCRQCHSPAHQVRVGARIEPRGGVRHGCVDCHRYHNGDAALARFRGGGPDPATDRGLNLFEFLNGLPANSKRSEP